MGEQLHNNNYISNQEKDIFNMSFLIIGIFIISFLVYIIFGLSVIECQMHEASILGFDSYSSFTSMYLKHFSFVKMYKHPLINIILMQITSMFACIIKSARINAIFCQALAASISNILFVLILNKFNIHNYIKILFSGIFMLCFSNIIFSSIPEIYIYSGFIQITFLYSAISIIQRKEKSLKLSDICLLSGLTVISFGLNMFNVITCLIFVFYIFLKFGPKTYNIIYNILKFLIIFVILFLSLSFLQNKLYQYYNPFYKSIEYTLKNKKIHPTQKAGLSFDKKYSNTERLYNSINGTVIYPFLPSKMEILKVYKDKRTQMRIIFKTHHSIFTILPILILFFVPLFYIIKKRKVDNPGLSLILLSILMMNIVAYCYFGFFESFLYSQNHLCYLVILLALLYNNVPLNNRILFCSLFFISQIFSNIVAILAIENYMIHYFPQNTYFTDKVIFCLVGIILLVTVTLLIISCKYQLKINKK